MAKQKSIVKETKVFEKDGLYLSEATTFVFETMVQKIANNVVSLEDSRTSTSTKPAVPKSEYTLKDGVGYLKTTSLIAAPLKWLTDNGYNERRNDTGRKTSKNSK